MTRSHVGDFSLTVHSTFIFFFDGIGGHVNSWQHQSDCYGETFIFADLFETPDLHYAAHAAAVKAIVNILPLAHQLQGNGTPGLGHIYDDLQVMDKLELG